MTVSAAKLEANRRNSLKSTGPRTPAGKEISSLNAVKHGARAETLVLRGEDPRALEERREAWRACLSPGDDVEERLVDDAVAYTWQQDRARRAQVARLNADLINAGVDQDQTDALEVDDLGRRLFKDRQGPLTFYPTHSERSYGFRAASTSYAAKGDDPDRPAELLLRLQSTLAGCEWLLGEWAGLKAILDRGQSWLSSDKLKAVRLLGKQPFDALDDRDVAMVFLASLVLKADKGKWYWEISMELNQEDTMEFRNKAAVRELDSIKPQDPAKAREALAEMIERATQRLALKADAHRERARLLAALAPDIMAFDESPGGERLRRYELTSGRGLARSLDELRKHRRSTVVPGQFSVVSHETETSAEPIAPNEATDCRLPAANSTAQHSNDEAQETIAGDSELLDEPIAPNEATDGRIGADVAATQPTTDDGKLTIGGKTGMLAEPNAPNEPTEGRTDVVECVLSGEWLNRGREERRLAREASTRQLNRQSGPRPQVATAARAPRRGSPKKGNGKAGNQAKCPTAVTRRQEKETEAREMKELAGYVKILRELGGLAGPTRH
jgi:hypothetical protein